MSLVSFIFANLQMFFSLKRAEEMEQLTMLTGSMGQGQLSGIASLKVMKSVRT